MPVITSAPVAEANERIVRLALRKAGLAACPHHFLLQQHRGRLFIRCCHCGQETTAFQPSAVADSDVSTLRLFVANVARLWREWRLHRAARQQLRLDGAWLRRQRVHDSGDHR